MSVVHHLETAEQQRELFLWKFGDVPRADVNDWLKVSRAINWFHIVSNNIIVLT